MKVTRISLADAISLLKERGSKAPENDLYVALRRGDICAEGLVQFHARSVNPAGWRDLIPAWWHHVNGRSENCVWFYSADTEHRTPFRAEDIEIPRASLDALWPEEPAIDPIIPPQNVDSKIQTTPLAPRKRGPKPIKLPETIKAMRSEINSGTMTEHDLHEMKELVMHLKYNVSRYTARKARDQVLSECRQTPTSDN